MGRLGPRPAAAPSPGRGARCSVGELHRLVAPLREGALDPLGRVVDMLLRPRVENLDIDLDWWVYSHHHKETEFSFAYAALNALFLALAACGGNEPPGERLGTVSLFLTAGDNTRGLAYDTNSHRVIVASYASGSTSGLALRA